MTANLFSVYFSIRMTLDIKISVVLFPDFFLHATCNERLIVVSFLPHISSLCDMKEMTASSQKYPITSETHSLIMSTKAKDVPQAAEPSFEQSASGDTESIDTRIVFGEDAPAYKVLQDANLLVTKYRKQSFEDIFEECDLTPNSSHSKNFDMRMKYGVYWTPGCGFLLYVSFYI